MAETMRLTLPLLDAGQAQKEMTVNEALQRLDLLTQASVVAVATAVPPAPTPGQAWIVGAAPSGDWAGHADAVAGWTPGGWRFAAAQEGMSVWSVADGCVARFVGGQWRLGVVAATRIDIAGAQVVGSRAAAIPTPTGGGSIDEEARAAVNAILAALRGHGLIAT